ncbi:hypothetical protein HOLleu_00395 [Holothuria leucospilota]|uniref:Uncharacterized protein n=1 Tax=Holothuria leucospilota TaxID=206669 RepID=A0A9Q1CPD5_HOLLE|nr:hypothetical protein HOLleu_00395 [Holothuria leucospilota]
MARKLVLLVVWFLILLCYGMANFDVKLSKAIFDGGFLIFPVKRAKVQQLLDEINSQFDDEDVNLFLPSEPVLQDVIGCDEHVINVGFGTIEAVSFNGVLSNEQKARQSTFIGGLATNIPYLTSKNGDMEKITLQVNVFTSEGGHQIEPNVILPPPIVAGKYVKVIKGNTTDIRFKTGDLQLHVIGERAKSCQSYGKHGVADAQEYENEYQISRYGPDFSICDQYPDLQVDLCNVYRDPKNSSVLKEAGNNVCIYWVPTDDIQSCEATFHVVSMSDAMKELLLLDEDEEVLEAAFQTGTFDSRIVFPCIE